MKFEEEDEGEELEEEEEEGGLPEYWVFEETSAGDWRINLVLTTQIGFVMVSVSIPD